MVLEFALIAMKRMGPWSVYYLDWPGLHTIVNLLAASGRLEEVMIIS